MSPSLYEIIAQGGSLMSAIVAKMQQEKDNPENVKLYVGELNKSVNALLKVQNDEFTPEGWKKYQNILTEINDVASQLAEDCENPDRIIQLTSGNLKTILRQFGDIIKSERPEIRGKSFWDRMKEKFNK